MHTQQQQQQQQQPLLCSLPSWKNACGLESDSPGLPHKGHLAIPKICTSEYQQATG